MNIFSVLCFLFLGSVYCYNETVASTAAIDFHICIFFGHTLFKVISTRVHMGHDLRSRHVCPASFLHKLSACIDLIYCIISEAIARFAFVFALHND